MIVCVKTVQIMQRLRGALIAAGFAPERISGFYLNEPGQHNESPIGGDHITSPGAKETQEGLAQGAAAGGAVGVAVGAATSVVTGPVGPIVGGLVGAHVGSLFSFSKMKDRGEHEEGEPGFENMREPRKAGMLVAVAFDDPAADARAVDILRGLGAFQIERAEGNIVAGDWADFDPNSMPVLVQ